MSVGRKSALGAWRWLPPILGGIAALGTLLLFRRSGAAPTGPRRVAAIGDSLTADGRYLDTVLAALPPGSEARAWGYGGQGSRVIASHLPEVLAWRPTDVIVLAGVNDLASRRPLSHITANLSAMYAAIRAARARVIAVTVLPWGRRPTYDFNGTVALNRWIRAASVDRVVETATLGDETGWLLPQFTRDGVHLTADGNAALGELIAEQAF